MRNKLFQLLFVFLISILLQGCIVGKDVAAPFHITGAVVNTVTPDIVGDTISVAGDVVDTAIPF